MLLLMEINLHLNRGIREKLLEHLNQGYVQRIFHTVDKVVVVPHKFKGILIIKGLGKMNFICTNNLVPGKVL